MTVGFYIYRYVNIKVENCPVQHFANLMLTYTYRFEIYITDNNPHLRLHVIIFVMKLNQLKTCSCKITKGVKLERATFFKFNNPVPLVLFVINKYKSSIEACIMSAGYELGLASWFEDCNKWIKLHKKQTWDRIKELIVEGMNLTLALLKTKPQSNHNCPLDWTELDGCLDRIL